MEIVVTGSNSKMLSSDLSTLIGGRYREIYIQALSYEEFMLFHQLTDSDETLAKYIQFGGSREGDLEKVIENIIYNHLRRFLTEGLE